MPPCSCSYMYVSLFVYMDCAIAVGNSDSEENDIYQYAMILMSYFPLVRAKSLVVVMLRDYFQNKTKIGKWQRVQRGRGQMCNALCNSPTDERINACAHIFIQRKS
mmetsp:Transcript_36543/g.45694  ORF Transcript_36543/g.45694 Transcript_36543/m.45694 type:complete len:106 (-) Transcript_36543:294-611(-)